MFDKSNIKQALIDRDGKKCSVCGAVNIPLEVDHITPRYQGGSDDLDNLRLACRNCNIEGANIREVDFVFYLSQLIGKNSRYRNVAIESPVGDKGRFRADLVAEKRINNYWETIVIECKSYSTFTKFRLNEVYIQLLLIKKSIGKTKLILAFPGELSADSYEDFTKLNIGIWDLKHIAREFANEISSTPHPKLQSMLMVKKSLLKTEEETLADTLKQCKAGVGDWVSYQKLIGTILESLFCPPLSHPISELADAYHVNRRDYIFPNYAEKGFWSFLREKYLADYIVVDAKNYKGSISKSQILQIANYLKIHGAGLFGVITCRNGGDQSCIHTLREVWATDRKLIVILTDHDLVQMLLTKSLHNPPEDIIRQRIEDFRLSL